MSDALGTAIAAEEHRHGMGYGDDADHCDGCAAEALRRLQAECEHDGERVDITTLDQANRQELCQRCGLVLEVER